MSTQLTENEVKKVYDTLEKAKRIRMGIVDAMVKDGIPDNTTEIRPGPLEWTPTNN